MRNYLKKIKTSWIVLLLLFVGCSCSRQDEPADETEASDTGSDLDGDSDGDTDGDADGDGDGDSDGDSDGDTDGDSDGDSDGDTDGDSDGDSDSDSDDVEILDNYPPSYDPPGGLEAKQVPQFILIGFDDNRYTDGMQWILDFLKDKKNPAGSGNPRTYDGQSVKVAFYLTTNALADGGDPLLETWKEAKKRKYEIANHTHTHADVPKTDGATWANELDTCIAELEDKLGVDNKSVWGVRAPYLSYNAGLYEHLVQLGDVRYDCSVMHIPDDHQDYNYVWPYTLDNDLHFASTQLKIGSFPGVWQIPVYNLPMEEIGYPNMCGFDSSVYAQHKTPDDFFNMMKWALELRLADTGNRSPLTIGAHTDLYSATNPDAKQYDSYAPLEKRQKTFEDFINYALEKPDVRFVTGKQILQWISDPVPL